MPTLGEELRQRREQRGVTLAEISESTRIGTRFLKAIETDNFSVLPGGIFTRSFIRAYAKHVGMSEDDAVALYLQQVAGHTTDQHEGDKGSGSSPISAEKPKNPVAPARPVIPKPLPATEPKRFEPVAFRQSTSRTSWPTLVIGAGIVVFIIIIVVALVKQLNQAGNETGTQASKPAAQPAVPPTQPANPQPNQPAERPASGESVPAGEPLIVKLEAATGDSWIKYQVDDAKPTTLVLKQGQSQDLPPAQTQVTLNYGNRLTLKLKINNREASFPPDTPKFKSQVVISRENFQTYFQ